MVTVVSVLSVVAAIFCMVFLSQGSFSMIGYFIDLPGLIFLALLVIPAVCISGFAKDFGKGLAISMHKNPEVTLLQLNKSIEAVKLVQKLLIYAGVFISLFSFVVVVQVMPDAVQYSAQEYMQVFGNNFAVAILPLMYALVFSLLLLPVSAVLQRKKIEYIQK